MKMYPKFLFINLCFMGFVVLTNSLFAQSSMVDQQLKVMIPLYVYPDKSDWEDVRASAKDVDITVIINDNNGKTTQSASNPYPAEVERLENAGFPTLAYIATCYACGDLDQVKKYIDDNWDLFGSKGLDGFFFDQGYSTSGGIQNCSTLNVKRKDDKKTPCPNNATAVDAYQYYQALYQHAKGKSQSTDLKVVLNTGVVLHDSRYLAPNTAIADIVLTGENSFKNIDKIANQCDNKGQASQYATALHSSGPLNTSTLKNAIHNLAARNFGYVYITESSWSKGIPSYWNNLLSIIRAYNQLQEIELTYADNNGNQQTIYVHPVDQSEYVKWNDQGNISNLSDKLGRSAALADFDGKTNTNILINQLGTHSFYAANLCKKLVAYGHDDWYLPSLGELQAIYQQLGQQPEKYHFKKDHFYWSSTEQTSERAWRQKFDVGGLSSAGLKDVELNAGCRCVRK